MLPPGDRHAAALREVSLDEADRVLTIKEICYVLKKSRWTVWRWKSRGCPIIHGRILWSALLVWLAGDEQRTKDECRRLKETERVNRGRA